VGTVKLKLRPLRLSSGAKAHVARVDTSGLKPPPPEEKSRYLPVRPLRGPGTPAYVVRIFCFEKQKGVCKKEPGRFSRDEKFASVGMKILSSSL
jgi:hypothetical protein